LTQQAMHWQCLAFPELSTKQLYEILKIRQEVFAVEQNCVYLDVDGKDMDALHVFATRDDELIAYCRILPPGLKYPEASIGRVLSTSSARGSGAGRALMDYALAACTKHHPGRGIRISAQLYLEEFYRSFGFASCSLPYQEDGIPHIEMLKP
jgi:ElaA protein